MRILFIANLDERQRYKFVMIPLSKVGANVFVYHEKYNILSSFYNGIKALRKYSANDAVVLTGGDIRNVIWFYIIRYLFRSKVVLRFGGNPVSVRSSVQENLLNNLSISEWLRSRLGVIGTRLMLKQCDGVISVSEHLASQIRPMTKRKTKVCVAPPILDVELPHSRVQSSTPRFFRVLTVANINYREKYDGIMHIASALIDYCGRYPNNFEIVYDIVGGGAQLSCLREGINNFKLPKNLKIKIHGYQKEVSGYYEKSDIFLYCSTLDSYPLVLAEASAYGLPVIVNRWGPFPEMFSNKYEACFFDHNEPSSLIGQLEKVLSDNTLQQKMRRATLINFRKSNDINARGMRLKKFFSELR